jgi:hypothetical protein
MLEELDSVVLTEDFLAEGLKAGDIGVIVDAPESGETYLVEFVAYDGDTVALISVTSAQVWKAGTGNLPHVRRVVA